MTHLDDARCDACGWLVAADGVTIPAELDEPPEHGQPHRCDDTACTSRRTVTLEGNALRYA